MSNLQALIAQRDSVNAQIAEIQRASRAEGVAKVRELMGQYGLAVADLKAPGKARKVAPVKYRDAAGNTWSGRGFKPVWLRNALAAGVPLETLAVA